MSSKNKQRTAKLSPVFSRSKQSSNTLSDAIRSVNAGFGESLSAALKTGACSVALGTVVGSAMLNAPTAYAQEGTIEEVTVLGIRASLKRALDTKRDADGIVDAINSEDMGKFPDTNLAESLQRITGVSIDRSRGEGSKVTVRGLGADFNLVTFNGRQLPTQSGGGRSFDFANIASEGISAVNVYKTGNAAMPTGGMGATIDVITTKPLNDPGLSASVGVKLVNDLSTDQGSALTPEISAIYSNTFADDRVGVSVSASLQKRDHGVNSAQVGGWDSFSGTFGGTSKELPENSSQLNRPSATDIYGVPQNTGYEIAEFERERLNGQLTLQWQPIDSVTATVDYTYAEHDLARRYSNMSGWYYNQTQKETIYSDGPIASPHVFSMDNFAATNTNDFAMGVGEDGNINENKSLGFNVNWQATDRLAVTLDYHDSSAELRARDPFGTSALVSLTSFTRTKTTTHFAAGDIPILELQFDGPLDPADIKVSGSVFANALNRMDIDQTTLSGNFEIDEISTIDFGIQLTNVDNRAASSVVQRNTWSEPTAIGGVGDILSPASLEGAFDRFDGGNDFRLQKDYFTVSLESLVARMEEIIAVQGVAAVSPGVADLGPCGTGFCATDNFTTDRNATEETQAVYVQYSLALDDFMMPIKVHAGLRYEETDVESPALVPSFNAVDWSGAEEFTLIPELDSGGVPVQISSIQSGSYEVLLPNVDFSVEVLDGLFARASYSQTITRPSYGDLQGGFTVESLARVDGGNASLGNPGLKPIESQNYDVSVEWYFTDESYFSVGYFRKEIDNFIGTVVKKGEVLPAFTDLRTPVGGAHWNDAVAAGVTDPTQIREWIFDNRPTGAGVTPRTSILGQPGDPVLRFDVGQNVNSDSKMLDGWEVAVQHVFGETGFGAIVNATFVNADLTYNKLSINEAQVPLSGVSDSANIIAFYEKDGLQARIAYNWRDHYFAGVGNSNGSVDPTNVESYGQWDFSGSYEVNENLSVFVEGINITDETNRTYARTRQMVLNATQTGARYNFGARYKL